MNTFVRTALLSIALIIAIYPMVWLGLTSLKTTSQASQQPWALPTELHVENYQRVAQDQRFMHAYRNSFVVTISAVILLTIVGSLAGYGFGRYQFTGKRWLWGAFMVGLFLPVHAMLIPLHRLEHALALGRSWASLAYLVAIYVAFNLSFTIYFLRGFYRELPQELEDAARVDGCGGFGLFWRVMLPLSLPALTVTCLINAVMIWNEFIFALVLLPTSDFYTLPLAVKNFSDEQAINLPLTSAALCLTILPILIIFALCQRWIIRGITAGAVKG